MTCKSVDGDVKPYSLTHSGCMTHRMQTNSVLLISVPWLRRQLFFFFCNSFLWQHHSNQYIL